MEDTTRGRYEYRQVESILEERRVNARRALDVRRRRAFGLIPELEDIEYNISEAGLKYNRSLLSGSQSLSEVNAVLEGEIDALKSRRAELLDNSGLSADYMSLTPYCPHCGDTGYAPGAAGTPEQCACFKLILFAILEAASNIANAGPAGFGLFDETLYSGDADSIKYGQAVSPRDNIIKIRDSALRFVNSINGGANENLYFFGPPGTGKTFTAASIAIELMRSGSSALYISAPDLFNTITEHRLRAFRDDAYSDILFRRAFSCRLLVIDDLGIEPATEARYSEFIALLNGRLASGFYSTIISTNMDLKKLRERYDERILSRIIGSFSIIRFYGDDIRLRRPGIKII